VQGNPYIKMSTSIIDYIFRELAITYLGRTDLAHVMPEDLRGDTLHDEDDDPDFESEELISERVLNEDEIGRPKPAMSPRSTHTKVNGNGHGSTNGNGHHGMTNGRGGVATAVLAPPAKVAAGPSAMSKVEKILQARRKGYEGDPCTECGALTMVRSGACSKCDTCGATSGCS
jgi:ribonucleoside-diphosphate reductase alpha chain